MKLYSSGMSVAYMEEVRSKRNGKTYIRMTAPYMSNTINIDPALDQGNFIIDGESNPPSMVITMLDHSDAQPKLNLENQLWLRSGSVSGDEHVIADIGGGGFGAAYSVKNTPLGMGLNSATILPATNGITDTNVCFDVCGNGSGVWLASFYQGNIFRSYDDGNTWTQIKTALDPWVKIANNGEGVWWFAFSNGAIYQSIDQGETLVAIQKPLATGYKPVVFKYMNGFLYWIPQLDVPISYSNASQCVAAYMLPNGTIKTTPWSVVYYPGNIFYAMTPTIPTGGVGQWVDLIALGDSLFLSGRYYTGGYYYPIALIINKQTLANYGAYYSTILAGSSADGSRIGNLVTDGTRVWLNTHYYSSPNYYQLSSKMTSNGVFTNSTSISPTINVNFFNYQYSDAITGNQRLNFFYKDGSIILTDGSSSQVKTHSTNAPIKTAKVWPTGQFVNVNNTFVSAMAGSTILQMCVGRIVIRMTGYTGMPTMAKGIQPTVDYVRIR